LLNGRTTGRILLLVSAADQLTVARAVSVPVVVVLFAWDFPNHAYWATGLFAIAMLTDQIDGWLARRSGQSTDLGRILDPVADKILVLAAMIVLIPPFAGWMVAAIVAREFVVSGLRLAALERGVVVAARDLSKIKTWLQGIAVFLGGLAAGGAFSDDVAWWSLLVALVFTLVSGLDYAWQAPTLLRGRQTA
jgi:CDP-diacylglycerol---glycerol-3-phosphate 3-phosphatidyltransferase